MPALLTLSPCAVLGYSGQDRLGLVPKEIYTPVRRDVPERRLRSGSRRPSWGRTMGIARPRWMSPRRAAALVAMVIAAGVTPLAALSDILVYWAWFSAVGYVDLFWIVLITKVSLFASVFVASAAVLGTNG